METARQTGVTTERPLPKIKSFADLEAEYRAFATQAEGLSLDLGNWLPSLHRYVRPLVPGELCFIMGDTGVGKTGCLMNIALSQQAERALLFELELPGTLIFERAVSIAYQLNPMVIEQAAKDGDRFSVTGTGHLYTVDETRLSAETMKAVIEKANKDGINPRFVFVDYISLMGGGGKNRYERVAQCAEDLKILAKETNTVIVAATQMHRQGEEGSYEPDLHSAKNAGEIENSCGLMLGIWRDQSDATLLWVKVLKNTKGRAQGQPAIPCNFDGPTMRITERVIDRGEEV